jgi:flagellar secretion chaperone FliS
MYVQPGYAAAKARYRDIDIGSKVEGATPHRLIAILYEETLKLLDTIAAGLGAGSTAARPAIAERRAKVMSILMSLEGSLDHGEGGDLSRGLAAVYREARRLISEGLVENDPKRIIQAREMIGEIADAWATIA